MLLLLGLISLGCSLDVWHETNPRGLVATCRAFFQQPFPAASMEVKPGLPSTSFKLCVEQECVVAIRLEFDGVQVLHTDTTDVDMQAWEVYQTHATLTGKTSTVLMLSVRV